MRALESVATPGEEVHASIGEAAIKQAPRDRQFCEVMLRSAKDVAYPGAVQIALHDEARRQIKCSTAAKDRRFPLLGIRMANAGETDMSEYEATTILTGRGDRQRDDKDDE